MSDARHRSGLRSGWPGSLVAVLLAAGPVVVEATEVPFGPPTRIAIDTTPHELADIDGDGDVDVVANQLVSGLVWFMNGMIAPPGSWQELPIDPEGDRVDSAAVGDLDWDGTPDVVAKYKNRLVWYEASFDWKERTIELVGLAGGERVSTADLNNDDKADVILGQVTEGERQLDWFEAAPSGPDPNKPSFTRHVISSEPEALFGHRTADLDGDGDLDLVASGSKQVSSPIPLVWYVNNADAAGPDVPWTEQTIDDLPATVMGRVASFRTADMDGDGDIDIIASGQTVSDLTWYENDPGDGSAWVPRVIDSTGRLNEIGVGEPKDLDRDGDVDIPVSVRLSSDVHEVGWYDNPGDGSAWTYRMIRDDAAMRPGPYVGVADIDGDGDPDVLCRMVLEYDWELVWLENQSVPIPDPPTGLEADQILLSKDIQIRWQDMSDNETGFRLQYRAVPPPPLGWKTLAETGPAVTTYRFEETSYNTRYSFRVAAFNATGASAWSNTDSVYVTAFVPPSYWIVLVPLIVLAIVIWRWRAARARRRQERPQ